MRFIPERIFLSKELPTTLLVSQVRLIMLLENFLVCADE